ncbi:hypothetical protein H0A36_12435 [Endozoicomonas sp. SM1973]|uniref:Uncharacterized protein n=1 Tax=Spartinivicinus marinus TaxID=2994442 RepID=A0A853HYK2_9GAMM|nr:hypothetical protein [Spartinivicinus marinus]MCX4026448.1 hypothetical protein [Spartinivicinus marinus]NYZ66820.1 hypothetical protein [Spartinivicinus marinus]
MLDDKKLNKEYEPEVICPNCSSPVNKIDFEIIGCPTCHFKSNISKDTPNWELEPMESSDSFIKGKDTWFNQ